ncbi:hypothetical protein [Celeribacter sp.]|uniref:hypothetical protein n=1 Tax=Celeribacter sp. TaxID=1890673 RepID=UPI003A908008
MSTSKIALLSALLAGLTACGSPNRSVGPNATPDTPTTISAISDLRGTPNNELSAKNPIVRLHAAQDDPASDYFLNDDSVTVHDNGNTLTIEGMPFDGDGSYVRLTSAGNPTGVAGQNGQFYLYENAESTQTDPVGGSTIDQFYYIALHQSKDVGDDSVYVTIVGSNQSSNLIPLEGFVYGRTGGVVMATANQGKWTGDYAAVRTYGDDMPDYVSGLMELEIDFDELNSAGAIRYVISDRQVFDTDGNLIDTLDSIRVFAENGALDAQGEFQATAAGATIQGMLAGDDAEVAVGTVIMGNETGGFILDRNP